MLTSGLNKAYSGTNEKKGLPGDEAEMILLSPFARELSRNGRKLCEGLWCLDEATTF